MGAYATQEGFIFIPEDYSNYVFKVLINSTDVTSRLVDKCKYKLTATDSVGTFEMNIENTNEDIANTFGEDDIVYIYADFNDATTLVFKGYIEVVTDELRDDSASFLISGSHVSRDLLLVNVSYEATDTEAATVLKALFTNHTTGYDATTYVEDSGILISPKWSDNTPFLTCTRDICEMANATMFIDDNKAVHFFLKGSKLCTTEAVVQGDNLLDMPAVTTDYTEKRNRIKVYGEDDESVPIIYTKDESGTNTVKERVEVNKDLSSEAQVTAMAEGIYTTENGPKIKGNIKSLILLSLQPGYNLWVSIMSKQIHKTYQIQNIENDILNIQSMFSLDKTQVLPQVFRTQTEKSMKSVKIVNPNQLDYSFNFTFDDNTNISTFNNTTVSAGSLMLTSSASTGYFISLPKTTTTNVTEAELKLAGNSLGDSTYLVTFNGGASWLAITKDQLLTLAESDQGTSIMIKATMNKTTDSPAPELKSLALLFSTV
jgi:hypothetical protein